MGQARTAYKQLLMETKKITDKSLSLVKEKDSGHLAEIEEVLSKDRRYLDLDGFKDEKWSVGDHPRLQRHRSPIEGAPNCSLMKFNQKTLDTSTFDLIL